MYEIKILWLIGLIFELRVGLVLQYTQLQLRSWCSKYIFILNTISTTRLWKKFFFQKMFDVKLMSDWFGIKLLWLKVVFYYKIRRHISTRKALFTQT